MWANVELKLGYYMMEEHDHPPFSWSNFHEKHSYEDSSNPED